MRSNILLLVCLIPLAVLAGEKTVPVQQVPAAVIKAAADRHPKGKVTRYVEEVDGTRKSYEVVIDLEGQKVELIIAADGKLEEEERTLTAKDLPPNVTKAIAASKYAKAMIGKVERVEDLRTRAPMIWEVIVEESGKRRELVFEESGALKKDSAAGKQD